MRTELGNRLAPPTPLGENLIEKWMLDPAVDFLNHGCFGARPRMVLRAQQIWRDRIDARPVQVLDRERDDLLADAKAEVGRFIGAAPEDFGFVTNATDGINAVLRSLRFKRGDELLTINHVYNAVRMTMRHVAARSGATMREIRVPLPLRSPRQIIDAIDAAITERTKLLLVDHITSPTAALMPVQRIIEQCGKRGVDVLVDGAHAPGMVDLDIDSLGAAYYSGNLHKWGCAPMGTGFLWVRPDRQRGIHPTTISHFIGQGLPAEFSWQGTRDISGWLAAPDAINFLAGYGWERVRTHNHDLAAWMQAMLCERLGVEPSTPPDGSMIGSMATIRLPDAARERFESPEAMSAAIYEKHRIEVPVFEWDGQWWFRPCCQIYNRAEQYERLGDVVAEMIG